MPWSTFHFLALTSRFGFCNLKLPGYGCVAPVVVFHFPSRACLFCWKVGRSFGLKACYSFLCLFLWESLWPFVVFQFLQCIAFWFITIWKVYHFLLVKYIFYFGSLLFVIIAFSLFLIIAYTSPVTPLFLFRLWECRDQLFIFLL